MPAYGNPRKHTAAVAAATVGSQKRARRLNKGSSLQSVIIPDNHKDTLPLSPRQALFLGSQAADFESQLRDSVPEDAIVMPTEASEAATIATTEAEVSDNTEELDSHIADNFEGIDWSCLTRYAKPLRTSNHQKSWVYQYGYRVCLRKDMERIYWICHKCHRCKMLDVTGQGALETTAATSSATKHLLVTHRISRDGVVPRVYPKGQRSLAVIARSGVKVNQATANAMGNFDVQAFRLAAVTWLVNNNIALSQFEHPAFRSMIQFANPEAERALWASHSSVSHFVIRLYNHMKPQVVAELQQAASKIHISFDGWTTKGGKRGFFGIVAHFADNSGVVKDVAIDLPQLAGAHTGDRIASCIQKTLQLFGITASQLGCFVLDNASNNDTAIVALTRKYSFEPSYRCLRRGAQTINLVGQAVIFGGSKAAFENDEAHIAVSKPSVQPLLE
jgi:hypothetical protein